MKIAWFTPFLAQSAIGKLSQIVTAELSKRCDIDLWLSENYDLHPTDLRTIYYDPNDDISSAMGAYDLVVYNFGDYLPYARDIYKVSKLRKGLVIIHDLIMHHFIAAYYLLIEKNTELYLREMARLYGEEGRRAAFESVYGLRRPLSESPDIVKYPLFEPLFDRALGIMVFSRFFGRKVASRFPGPVGILPVPVPPGFTEITKRAQKLSIPADKLVIMTLGWVNSYKRIDKVIESLGRNRHLLDKVLYVVVGSYQESPDYFNMLRSLIAKFGLRDIVVFTGYHQDDVLYSYMARADIFVNLRVPAAGASLTIIEELYFGKPVIVSDNGFFREFPDDVVIKVRVDDLIKDLGEKLALLIESQDMRQRFGKKAISYAIDTFNVQQYSSKFFEFLPMLDRGKPALDLIGRTGRALADMGVGAESPVVRNVAGELQNILDGVPNSYGILT